MGNGRDRKLGVADNPIAQILESITDGFCALDSDWRFIYVNENAVKILQRPKERLVGRCMWEEFPEAVGTIFEVAYRKAVAEGIPFSFEDYYAPFDRWFEVRGYPSSEGLSLYFRDITERRVVVEQLATRERQLADAQQMAGVGSWEWDLVTDKITWSDEMFRAFGMDPLGTDINYPLVFSLVHPEDARDHARAIARTLKTGTPLDIRFRTIRPDGQIRVRHARGKVQRNESGTPIRLVGVSQDITESTQIKERIERRNRELQALNAITTAVSSSLEISTVLKALRLSLFSQLSVSSGCVLLLDQAAEGFVISEHWGVSDPFLDRIRVLGMAAPSPQDRVGQDLSIEQRLARDVAQYAAELGLSQDDYALLPLADKRVLHGMAVLLFRTPAESDRERTAFLNILGQQVGVAIHNARLYEQVREGQEQLRVLSRRLVEVQENERRFLARELHDQFGQVLTGLRMLLSEEGSGYPGLSRDRIADAQGLVDDLLSRVRALSLDLRPAMLDDLGLLAALLWRVEQFDARSGIHVNFEHRGLDGRFAPDVETAAYRIVQEGLTNVARHAQVSDVTVHVWTSADSLCIQIEDHGRGFDLDSVGNTGGLTGMRERCRLLGGTFRVESGSGDGTLLVAELPLAHPHSAANAYEG